MIRSSIVAIQLPLAREPSVTVQGVGGGVLLRGLWEGQGLVGAKEIEIDRSANIKTSKYSQSPPSRLGIVSEL